VSGRGDAWCELSPADKRIFDVEAVGNARVWGITRSAAKEDR